MHILELYDYLRARTSAVTAITHHEHYCSAISWWSVVISSVVYSAFTYQGPRQVRNLSDPGPRARGESPRVLRIAIW